jgi:hypothetical protein
MDVEIVMIGGSSRWVLNQPRIRIGRDARCEVNLAGAESQAVAAEHVSLVVANGAVRLATGGSSTGETFLNDNPAGDGFVVRSGDILRLGGGGPELRIRLLDSEQAGPQPGYQPTRVMREPTQVLHEPTRISAVPAPTTVFTPPTNPAAPGRHGYTGETVYGGASGTPIAVPRATTVVTPRGVDAASSNVPPGQPYGLGRETKVQTTASNGDSEALRSLEGKLKGMRLILLANLVILVVLLFWVVQLNRQLAENRDELKAMEAQAQTAVGQFTPALDARLGAFEKRMDGIDAKMKNAEDRMIDRMNAAIPALLDKYIARKMAELKP